MKDVTNRLQPGGQEAVAGQDNTALAIKPDAGASLRLDQRRGRTSGAKVGGGRIHAGVQHVSRRRDSREFRKRETRQHGDPRIAKGKDTLYDHAIEGFPGKLRSDASQGWPCRYPDDLVKQASEITWSIWRSSRSADAHRCTASGSSLAGNGSRVITAPVSIPRRPIQRPR